MDLETLERDIEAALRAFNALPLKDAANKLLKTLGYDSERVGNESMDRDRFQRLKDNAQKYTNPSQKLCDEDWQDFHILMQVGDSEINESTRYQRSLFESKRIDDELFDSYLFNTMQLAGENYTRTQLSDITRLINKQNPNIPIMVLFRYGDFLTMAIINRREHKRQKNKRVLEKVTLIKDIRLNDPHAAHRKILVDLWFDKLAETESVKNFVTLHKAWEGILDTEPLNKEFYKRLYDWYQWAMAECTFPDNNKELQVIRLITRLLFIWFLKEKHLVPQDLFDEVKVVKHLKNFGLDTSDYYQAVLQNLFFATLNMPIGERLFSDAEPSTYRYSALLKDPQGFLEHLRQVPFVNGGLFDCLDTPEQCIDGFTTEVRENLNVPAKLFFDKKDGILAIFKQYKFTVKENTPVEIEVALDPELLGKVFENLLGAYNDEMNITERRTTGSYYTPRTVVRYMVDETLITYFLQRVKPYDNDQAYLEERLRYNIEDLLDYESQGEIGKTADHLIHEDEIDSLIEAVNALIIIDPAVGSGAFPMDILNKLVLILRKLDPKNERWKQKQLTQAEQIPDPESRRKSIKAIEEVFSEANDHNDYGRKLYLIQNCLYGVDIQPFAITIAKLRFFISLIIEQTTNTNPDYNYGIQPLPNLETKLVAANTLIGLKSLHGTVLQLDLFGDDTIKSLLSEIQKHHFNWVGVNMPESKLEHIAKEEALRNDLGETLARWYQMWQTQEQARIHHRVSQLEGQAQQAELEELQREYKRNEAKARNAVAEAQRVADWNPYDPNATADFFEPKYMFGVTQGFDIVIGNPPYAKSENVPQDRREQLTAYYGRGGDLYDYFIFTGYKLVSEQGVFSYIANDSFITASTKRRIRDLFLQNQLLQLVKAPANTFDAAIYTTIFILLKSKVENDSHTYITGEMNLSDFTYRSNGEVEYATIHQIPDRKLLLSAKNDWVLRLFALERVEKYCNVLDTGIHSGNVRDKIFFIENNGRRHKLLQGRQIQRYSIWWDSPKAKYRFVDIEYQPRPIPGIGRGGKTSKDNEYWHFCGPIENHHQPERLLMRQTDDDLIVAYHNEAEAGRFYTDNTLHTILSKSQETNLKYFCGLFNSRLLNFIYHSIAQEQGKSQAQVKIKVVRSLPVIVPEENDQAPIIELVDEILTAKSADPEADTTQQQRQIDLLVYTLYDLTDKEKAFVESSI